MPELDDFDINVLRNFVAEHWSRFVDHCAAHGISADELYVRLGGESEG